MSHRYTRLATGLLAGAAILSGCSGDNPVAPGGGGHTTPPTPVVWRQLSGGLGVGNIPAIWGISRDDVYAACDGGILHFDGSGWQAEGGPLPDSLLAIWGASGTVFAGGKGGSVLMRTNGIWSDVSGATALDVRGIHGTSASDVYVVAATPDAPDAAELLHFDGAMWTQLDTYNGVDANAVFATEGPVYVACDGGVMLRYNGANLLEETTPVTDDLLGVWASSGTDAYAVGRGGRIIHWDGTGWTMESSPVASDLYAVSGIAADNIMAVGDQGVLLHYDGTSWTPGQAGTSLPLYGACAFGDGRAVACGVYGSVLSGFVNLLAADYVGGPFTYESVWSGSYYYFVVGSAGNTGTVFDNFGDSWFMPEGLHAVSGFSYGDVYAAGDGGAIYRYDGADWQKQATPVTFTVRALTALVTRLGEPFRVYAAGDDGGLAVWKVGNWNVVPKVAGAEGHHFVDIWAAAIDDVFAVADNATSVVRYDDPYELADWTVEQTPATAPLLTVGGLRGDVYVASAAGEIFFNNGGGWTPVPSPVSTPLRDIRGFGENSLFAVGDRGVILQGAGGTWRKLDSSFPGKLLGLWGGTNRPLYAVGVDGAVLIHED